jgi:ATP-binding cassette, subfamily F, member 3
MTLVVLDKVSLALGGRTLFDGVDLQIGDQDRIGLIGPNGAGKSSLLRMLSGEQAPDEGAVVRRRGLRVGYLPQEVQHLSGKPLNTFVIESVPGRSQLQAGLEEAQAELEGAQGEGASEERIMELASHIAEMNEQVVHFETEFSAHRAERILLGLGFEPSELDRDVGELSGGWRMRAVLASLLFQRPDLLLLDEPTNHLDMPSVAWLGGFLRRYPGAFLLISHDREFLNEQIRRVVSFEPEGLRSYVGDYEHYRRQRAEELEVLEAQAKNLEQKREQMEKFVERFRAKASKARQAQSRLKQLEKMDKVDRPQQRRGFSFRFPSTERSGKEVLRVEGLCKSYGALQVLDGVKLRVDRGDRIAIIGRNGAGKTTLLRILADEIASDAGEVTWGHRTKVGYYAQHHAEVLDPQKKPDEAVWERVREGNATLVRGALGALRMRDEDIDKRIGVLSGGERARVALARLLVDPGNVLLMDEPTNHLDLESSEALAAALETFDGTLLFVSHNRHFLRSLATKIWCVQDGHVEVYPGTLDDYLRFAGQAPDAAPEAAAATAPASSAAKARGPDAAPPAREPDARPSSKGGRDRKRREAQRRQERNRVLGPLKKRVQEFENRIAALEERKAACEASLADPDLYADPTRRADTTRDYDQVRAEIDSVTEEWMWAQEELESRERELGR